MNAMLRTTIRFSLNHAVRWLAVGSLALGCAEQAATTDGGAAHPPIAASPATVATPASTPASIPAPSPSAAPAESLPVAATLTAPAQSATPSPPPVSPVAKALPQTERGCRACRGDWGFHGIANTPSCNCPTSDGGKRCRDGADCEGECIATDDPERQVTDAGPPARGYFVGKCSKMLAIFGCYRPIQRGASTRGPTDLSEAPQMICAD